VAFVRPHDIRVTREATGPALAAEVVRSNAAGPLANLELKRLDSGEQFAVQLSKEQYQALQPKPGEQVFVELRNVKVFADDYSI
jgi:sulfate transport system ATP-binding protein